jgi:glyoxylase-like metal-dependent hydrolase (beta-lactamase superfamily II)
MFYFFRFTTVIPESEWESITHIFVTHGDPDHYWHMDRVAEVSSAAVICNKTMARNIGGKTLGHLYLFWMIQIGFIIRQIKTRNARPFNDILSSRHLYVHIHRNS